MAEATSMTPGTALVVALTTASAQGAAIGTANSGQPRGATTTRFVATADCWIAIGTNPTAVAGGAGNFLLPAGSVEYFDVPFGHRVAGILAAGTGTLSLTPMTDY